MRHISGLTRAIIVCLLFLYSSATFGLMIDGVVHEVEHKIAEHKRTEALAAAEGIFPRPEPGKTYGCWPTIDLGTDKGPCPGCSQHQKASVAIIDYSHIFTFYHFQEEPVVSLNLGAEQVIILSERSEQLAPEPSIPPPKVLA